MKYDLAGNLANYLGSLDGLRDVSVQVVNDPLGSRGLRYLPIWRSASRSLVATVVRGSGSHAGSASPLEWTCLVYITLQGWYMSAALADGKSYRYVPRGACFLGALSRAAFFHGIFFI